MKGKTFMVSVWYDDSLVEEIEITARNESSAKNKAIHFIKLGLYVEESKELMEEIVVSRKKK